ncbi:unnamed protein product [Allacma fusca]|uniref:Uncharacterized protein n=1 Tax=Allacma fusca TaxID=39272 RepID=A0A8J2PS07_9HEXA|nr:unnamed protein product [Allacma fusca]
MPIRMPRFLRRLVRRHMKPVEERKAWTWKERLSMVYALAAWNAGGFVVYQIFTGNKHWPTTAGITRPEDDSIAPSAYYANLLGINKAKVVSIHGFHVKHGEYDATKVKKIDTETIEETS